jgi:K+-dependent Na+/Ca+ exchanger-like protein
MNSNGPENLGSGIRLKPLHRFGLFLKVYSAVVIVPLVFYCIAQMRSTSSQEAKANSPIVMAEQQSAHSQDMMAYAWWFIILYMFYFMAIVCDDYLMPAVDRMCHVFGLPDDVAGATLVAFACNGPELLTNVVAIFGTSGSAVGMGTVVGSAIFNCMCIVGACPIFSPRGYLDIDSKTFLRDIVFSALSIVVLWWALRQPAFNIVNSSVLFGLSFLYALIVAKSRAWFGSAETFGVAALEEAMLEHDMEGDINPTPKGADDIKHMHDPNDDEELFCASLVIPNTNDASGASLLAWRSVFVLTAPIIIVLHWTIPDCKRDSKAHRYISGFFLSMMWLSLAAWLVCEGALQLQDSWGIPASFTGLTIVSIGTSWPNLWASVVMARAGRGPGAVANALGSNVQNVFFVLAFPIWLRVLIFGNYLTDAGDVVMSVLWMGATVLVCFLCCALNKFRLTTPMGLLFIFIYVMYIGDAGYYDFTN